ncbi:MULTISPECIES: gamma-glutamylcyclotransferase [Pseudomonas]|uniref:gamma-glutamylcyclotransferase n=1 Tax=Pseudomonas TaxID=286 RepID=UPI000D6F4A11|nr:MULTISPECIES: gamma-glutamylcyclotransferase [unclassified Pseudomonas]MED5611120.1 gamma-glutamylcyclotransferase [Pseudomonas sp. JH-2]PWU31110.1 gamma-glutamylcyclotransferase [Pseudomonas sp. RW407]
MSTSMNLDGPFYPPALGAPERLSAEQLRASLEITMAEHGGGAVWLFAYGSLIWRPEFPVAEASRARVHGYHRGLYLWSLTHRGTPEMPGLVLGLDRGGSCGGFAYRLPDDGLDANLFALWQREMPYASYRPEWLSCRLEDGRRVRALGFVLERHLPSYAGSLPDSIVQRVFDSAQGHFGTTREYVEQTASALRACAMPDLNLEALLARCCAKAPG